MKKLYILIISTMMIMMNIVSINAKAMINNIANGCDATTVNSSYDITKDGKKDKIKLVKSGANLKVSINGKKALKITYPYEYIDYDCKYIQLKNGKRYLYFSLNDNNGMGTRGIYKYVSGVLKKQIDLDVLPGLSQKYTGKYIYDHCVESVKVSGNSITVKYSGDLAQLGISEYKAKYIYKKGKLNKATSAAYISHSAGYGALGKKITVKKNLKAYKSRSTNTSYFTVKKNKQVTVMRLSGKRNALWIKVKYGKKTGWIKVKAAFDTSMFKGVGYGG